MTDVDEELDEAIIKPVVAAVLGKGWKRQRSWIGANPDEVVADLELAKAPEKAFVRRAFRKLNAAEAAGGQPQVMGQAAGSVSAVPQLPAQSEIVASLRQVLGGEGSAFAVANALSSGIKNRA